MAKSIEREIEEIGATLDFLRQRKRAYQLTFGSPAAQEVLIDLASFCRANESTWHDDTRKADVLIGRRETWLRIQQHLNLSSEELMTLYSGRPVVRLITEDQAEEEDNG